MKKNPEDALLDPYGISSREFHWLLAVQPDRLKHAGKDDDLEDEYYVALMLNAARRAAEACPSRSCQSRSMCTRPPLKCLCLRNSETYWWDEAMSVGASVKRW